MRDGYRLWCARLGVAAEFPEEFDPAWHVAGIRDSEELMRSARLFGGLFAARAHDQEALSQLGIEQRKWCAGVASVQPLRGWEGLPAWRGAGIEVRGLGELAVRLENGFPGMWSRLRLMLPQSCIEPVEAALKQARSATAADAASNGRALRCWRMCRQHAAG
jgi:hypothetical protein